MSGKRKPTRQEKRQAWIVRANKMRAWLTERREAAIERRRLDEKAALLAGPSGGGSGKTVEMRELSAEFGSAAPEFVFEQTAGGPNRKARRHEPGGRTRHDRTYLPPTQPGEVGRWVWPTPASRNTPYVKRSGPAGGDHA